MKKTLRDLLGCFPFQEMRPEQRQILEWIHPLLHDNKVKNIVIEAGTGVGKSAIAKTISKYCGKSYVLTSTKNLQDQYYKDFHNMNADVMKGRVAYNCEMSDCTCADSRCIQASKNKSILKSDQKYIDCFHNRYVMCPYYMQLERVKKAEMYITSYAFFMSNYNIKGKYSDRLEPRDVLIFDECHLFDDILIDYLKITINKEHIDKKFNIVKDLTFKQRVQWAKEFINDPKEDIRALVMLKDILSARLEKIRDNLEKKYEKTKIEGKELEDLLKEIENSQEKLKKMIDKIEYFLKQYKEHPEEWIVEADLEKQVLIATPISSARAFENFMNNKAPKRIFMSATIFGKDMICKELGLNEEETRYINVNSTFPPDRSPVIIAPIANFKYPHYNEAAEKCAGIMEMLFNYFKNEKGVIHTSSYQISNLVLDKLSKTARKRLVTRTKSENNEELIEKHSKSKTPTILMSPSIMSGVDLKDDLARFQIVLRLPYISLADPRIKYISKTDFPWYAKKMLRELVQSTGRATRSENDWAATFILDSRFEGVVRRYSSCLPKSFKDRLVYAKNFNINNFLKNVGE